MIRAVPMSDDTTGEADENSVVDAISAVAVILIPVVGIIYWLSGLPTS